MTQFPQDTREDLIRFYGNPDPDGDGTANRKWEDANLTLIKPPFQMTLAWDVNASLRGIRIHTKCAPSLLRVLDRIWIDCGKDQKRVEAIRAHLFGGSYAFRPARGLSRLSTHAFGAAIDLDPANNGLGKRYRGGVGMMHPIVVKAFQAEGWTWGGNWERPDAMHFQAANV